jgi:hypothetical protein
LATIPAMDDQSAVHPGRRWARRRQ